MPADLHQILLAKQDDLISRLAGSRAIIDHPGEKGEATELDWRSTIQSFLPERYQVSKASVIDADGRSSDVIDVVIHDRHYCPLFFEYGGNRYIPAESVYAVLEIKQELNKGHIEYAADKAESVRSLRRTSAQIVERGQRRQPRPLFRILSGVLTLESGWSSPLGDPLAEALTAATDSARIDLGCALRDGAFEAVYGDDGTVQLVTSEPDAALMFFFLRLFARLQGLGTVSAIDLADYGRVLEAG